jgi:hypothetical protein
VESSTLISLKKKTLPLLLQAVPLNVRESMRFPHGSVPSHFSRQMRKWLSVTFRAYGSSVGFDQWPPRSPYVKPFLLWGRIKDSIHATNILDGDDLVTRTSVAATDITAQHRQMIRVRISYDVDVMRTWDLKEIILSSSCESCEWTDICVKRQ